MATEYFPPGDHQPKHMFWPKDEPPKNVIHAEELFDPIDLDLSFTEETEEEFLVNLKKEIDEKRSKAITEHPSSGLHEAVRDIVVTHNSDETDTTIRSGTWGGVFELPFDISADPSTVPARETDANIINLAAHRVRRPSDNTPNTPA